MTEYVDNMWATVDTEELNPKEEGEREKKRFCFKIVILLTKDTQLITGGRHFIS